MAEIRVRLREADGELPDVCMRCGEPATVVKSKKMQWCPPWVGILILGGAIPYVIVAAIMTRRTRVQAPLCDAHKGHWLWRNVIVCTSLVVLGVIGVACLIGTSAIQGPNHDTIFGIVCAGDVLLLLAWIIVLVVCQTTAIRPKEITDSHIVINGVCDAFADAVTDGERKRRKRGRNRPDDWEDGEEEEEEEEEAPRPRRRRPPPPPDAFED